MLRSVNYPQFTLKVYNEHTPHLQAALWKRALSSSEGLAAKKCASAEQSLTSVPKSVPQADHSSWPSSVISVPPIPALDLIMRRSRSPDLQHLRSSSELPPQKAQHKTCHKERQQSVLTEPKRLQNHSLICIWRNSLHHRPCRFTPTFWICPWNQDWKSHWCSPCVTAGSTSKSSWSPAFLLALWHQYPFFSPSPYP